MSRPESEEWMDRSDLRRSANASSGAVGLRGEPKRREIREEKKEGKESYVCIERERERALLYLELEE